MKVIATRGISNSGKSTWALEWLNDAPNRARVNRDVIREHLFGAEGITYDKNQEAIVDNVHLQLLEGFLSEGKDVVVDNTHVGNAKLRVLRDIAKKYGAEFEIKCFHIGLDEALARSRKRAAEGGLFVPQVTIEEMYTMVTERPLASDLSPYVVK